MATHSRTLLTIGALALCLTVGSASASHDWSGFRGPHQSGGIDGATLIGPGGGTLSVGWKVALGSGYSSVIVAEGQAMAMFADGDADYLGAYDVKSGAEKWRYRIADTYAGHDGSHDGPISTPIYSDGRVFGLGAWGHLFSVDAKSGKQVWATHLVDDHGGVKPHYGFTSSPTISAGVLVVETGAPEGKAISGFDPATGKLLWSLGDDRVQYHSPIAATVNGSPMVIAAGSTKIHGIDAASGKELWSYEHGGDQRAMGGETIVPVPAGDGRFFIMHTTDASSMIQVSYSDETGYGAEKLWETSELKTSYVTPLYHEGAIYGISGRVLNCIDAATGERRWRSREPGDGFLTRVGDQIAIVTKPGTVHVIKASAEGYEELARMELFGEHSWSEMAFADGALFARSMNELARIDVTQQAEAGGSSATWLGQTKFGAFLEELHAADNKMALLDAFMAKQPSFPIVEKPNVVHFVFRGEASDVGIVGDMIGFRREDPMQRVDGTDFFYYSTRLEPNAAVTYGFIKEFEDEPSADPLNAESADGLFGEVSFFAMPAWEAPRHIAEADTSRRGSLEEVSWEREVKESVDGVETTKKEQRSVKVYLPAGFDRKNGTRYPVLYMFGGREALAQGGLKETLDNLIGERVQPMIAVFVLPRADEEEESVGRRDDYIEMVAGEIVPLIDGRYPTVATPAGRACAGGGGFGAAALVAAAQKPDVFGRVGSHSAMLFSTPVGEMLPSADESTLMVYMNWGTYDMRSPHEAWDMAEDNRRAWSAMRAKGFHPAGGEVPQGYGWKCWRGQTDEMLSALFPL